MIMGHDRLENHFKSNFGMVQHHKWSLSDLEGMMPWERYVYLDLLQSHIREEEQKRVDRENDLKARMSTANRRKV